MVALNVNVVKKQTVAFTLLGIVCLCARTSKSAVIAEDLNSTTKNKTHTLSGLPRVGSFTGYFASYSEIRLKWEVVPPSSGDNDDVFVYVYHGDRCDTQVGWVAGAIGQYSFVYKLAAPVRVCLKSAVQNKVTSSKNITLNRDVKTPPVILGSRSVQDVFFEVGNEIEYWEVDPCEAVGDPAPTITWFRQGSNVDHVEEDGDFLAEEEGSFSIGKANASHEGLYICVASNKHGKAMVEKVRLVRAFLDRFPPSQDVVERRVNSGKSLMLDCRNKPASVPRDLQYTKVTWARVMSSGERVPVDTSSGRLHVTRDGKLVFVYTTEEDRGEYACKVFNSYVDRGEWGSKTNLQVDSFHLVSTAPQLIYSTPRAHQNLLYGRSDGTLVIDCVFSGYPIPDVRWYSGDQLLQTTNENSKIKINDFGTSLSIENGGLNLQSNVIACVANNSEGSSERVVFDVMFNKPPTFDVFPLSQNASVGDNVTFECVSQGSPLPAVQWLIDGLPVQTLAVRNVAWRIIESGNKLHINRVSKEDTCVVQCNASNNIGNAYANAYLNVFDSPRFQMQGNNSSAMSITVGSERYEIPCRAQGDSALELETSWTFNGSRIKQQKPYISLQKNNSLVIDLTDTMDFANFTGEYTCEVNDGLTAIHKTTTLVAPLSRKPKAAIPKMASSVTQPAMDITLPNYVVWGLIALAAFVAVVLSVAIVVCVVKKSKSLDGGSNTNLSDMTHLSDRVSRYSETLDGRYGSVCRCRTSSGGSSLRGDLENLLGGGDGAASGILPGDESLRATIQEVYVDRDKLHIGSLIGKGQFGRVYLAYLLGESKCNEHGGRGSVGGEPCGEKVAVKTLKYKADETEMVELFLREAVMMRDFRHPHVLSLIGITFAADTSPMVVLPYMAHGDLKTYVQLPEREVTILELLKFGLQVARGMVYLSARRFVHRDLACRNCMVDEHGCVRVADFGLSRDLFSRDYYRVEDGHTPLPVRWMAPECLAESLFTSMSDVWSFGVLLWELMTRGATPYPHLDNWDVPKAIKAGEHLPQPDYCPDSVYRVMTDCWQLSPHVRVTFERAVKELSDIVKGGSRASGGGGGGGGGAQRGLYMNMLNAVAPAAHPQADYRLASDC